MDVIIKKTQNTSLLTAPSSTTYVRMEKNVIRALKIPFVKLISSVSLY